MAAAGAVAVAAGAMTAVAVAVGVAVTVAVPAAAVAVVAVVVAMAGAATVAVATMPQWRWRWHCAVAGAVVALHAGSITFYAATPAAAHYSSPLRRSGSAVHPPLSTDMLSTDVLSTDVLSTDVLSADILAYSLQQVLPVTDPDGYCLEMQGNRMLVKHEPCNATQPLQLFDYNPRYCAQDVPRGEGRALLQGVP